MNDVSVVALGGAIRSNTSKDTIRSSTFESLYDTFSSNCLDQRRKVGTENTVIEGQVREVEQR